MTTAAESKGERTRRRVLDAAVEHFAGAGLDAGSVPAIARRVGVSHSALYQHFGRKQDLFRAAVDADMTALFSTVTPALAEANPTAEHLVSLIADLAAASGGHPLARRVLANIDVEQTDALRDLPALAELQVRLAAALADGQAAGTIRPDLDPTTTGDGLIGVGLALLVVTIRLDGLQTVPRAAGTVRFLTDVLRAPDTSPSHPPEGEPR